VNAAAIRASYETIRTQVGPRVTVVVATKYVSVEQMGMLAEAGVEVVGENRAQELERKHAEFGDTFRWHFIGHLQSNKAKTVDRLCELVHSVDSESSARRLTVPFLLEVNLAGEASKRGLPENEVEGFVERHEGVRGLMAMPPATDDPECSRPFFARLAALAAQYELPDLSMGTSQDWQVAADEGATLVRVGGAVFGDDLRSGA
jgi:PLP dependent protein